MFAAMPRMLVAGAGATSEIPGPTLYIAKTQSVMGKMPLFN
jgi:hypothetical protein